MTDPRKEIEDCNMKLMEAFCKDDFKGMANFYTEDCKVMEPGAVESFGREGVEAVFRKQKEAGASKVELTIEEVGSLGPDICFERHKFRTCKDDGKTALEEGKSLVIWKKLDGRWQAYIDIFNSNA